MKVEKCVRSNDQGYNCDALHYPELGIATITAASLGHEHLWIEQGETCRVVHTTDVLATLSPQESARLLEGSAARAFYWRESFRDSRAQTSNAASPGSASS